MSPLTPKGKVLHHEEGRHASRVQGHKNQGEEELEGNCWEVQRWITFGVPSNGHTSLRRAFRRRVRPLTKRQYRQAFKDKERG